MGIEEDVEGASLFFDKWRSGKDLTLENKKDYYGLKSRIFGEMAQRNDLDFKTRKRYANKYREAQMQEEYAFLELNQVASLH